MWVNCFFFRCRDVGLYGERLSKHILGVRSLSLERETSTGLIANFSREFANFKREFADFKRRFAEFKRTFAVFKPIIPSFDQLHPGDRRNLFTIPRPTTEHIVYPVLFGLELGCLNRLRAKDSESPKSDFELKSDSWSPTPK